MHLLSFPPDVDEYSRTRQRRQLHREGRCGHVNTFLPPDPGTKRRREASTFQIQYPHCAERYGADVARKVDFRIRPVSLSRGGARTWPRLRHSFASSGRRRMEWMQSVLRHPLFPFLATFLVHVTSYGTLGIVACPLRCVHTPPTVRRTCCIRRWVSAIARELVRAVQLGVPSKVIRRNDVAHWWLCQ